MILSSAEMNFKYLFPFEKIPNKSRILIYGAGIMGQAYLRQILICGYCKVVGFVDRNYLEYENFCVPVYSPDVINTLEFDYVVIAVRGAINIPGILNQLKKQKVPAKKIIYVLERVESMDGFICGQEDTFQRKFIYAFNKQKPSIAISVAGGLGDFVIQKRLLTELTKLLPSVSIDIYTAQSGDFLRWLYSDIENIQNVLMDLGVRYISQREKYSFAIQVVGSGFIKVDYINPSGFYDKYREFYERIKRLKVKCEEEKMSVSMPSALMFKRRMFNGDNCYTGFNYGDVFSITDKKVSIPFMNEFYGQFQKMKLSKFITVNVGNGSNVIAENIAKAWPVEHFQKTIALFKKKYPDVEVVQIGASDEPILNNADRTILGKPIGLIVYLLKNAMFHFDIEGGLVHLASQIGTKCIVLFGPTPKAYYAYENNINISIGNCHDCYGYYLDTNRCARNMDKPECMYGITPQLAMKYIDVYMKESNWL